MARITADDRLLVRMLELRAAGEADWPKELSAALRCNSAVVQEAASLAADFGVREVCEDLKQACRRLVDGGDRGACGKAACVEALVTLEHDDAAFYDEMAALRQVQWTPPGGEEEVAGPVRASAAHGLANTDERPPGEVLARLADLVADDSPLVRKEASLAAARCGGLTAVPMLRLAARTERSAEALGGVLSGLLMATPVQNVPLVAEYLSGRGDVAFEAAMALAECRRPDAREALLTHCREVGVDATEGVLCGLALTRSEEAIGHLLGLLRAGCRAAVPALASIRFVPGVEEKARRAAKTKPLKEAVAAAFF